MPLEIIRHDITQLPVDAIVNAANQELKLGGGVCGAIFSAAGAEQLTKSLVGKGPIPVGEAVITPGFDLPAKHVIHAVGPVWHGGQHGEEELLRSAYLRSLHLAKEHQLDSIAFPLISSGIYGYPKEEAINVAISAIGSFLMHHDMQVYLVVFDKKAFSLSDKLFQSIEAYIDDHYVGRVEKKFARSYAPSLNENIMAAERIPKPAKGFSERLFELIDQTSQTEPEIYKRANLDRKHFSKIRSNPSYKPSKSTVIALAIALELNLSQAEDLLRRAGYALSPSDYRDLIVEWFIKNANYNIFEINQVLFAYDQPLLGN